MTAKRAARKKPVTKVRKPASEKAKDDSPERALQTNWAAVVSLLSDLDAEGKQVLLEIGSQAVVSSTMARGNGIPGIRVLE